jgi:hypothetical protein
LDFDAEGFISTPDSDGGCFFYNSDPDDVPPTDPGSPFPTPNPDETPAADTGCPFPACNNDEVFAGIFEADAERFLHRLSIDEASPACLEADAERPFSIHDSGETPAECLEVNKKEEEEEEEDDDIETARDELITAEFSRLYLKDFLAVLLSRHMASLFSSPPHASFLSQIEGILNDFPSHTSYSTFLINCLSL